MSIPVVPGAGRENVRIVQELYAAFARLDPEVVWCEPANPYNPAAGTRRGHAGFLEWARIGHEAEDVIEVEPQRFLVDADAVAVVGRTVCRARATGRTYATDFAHLVVLRDGKVVLFREYFDTWAAAAAFRTG